MKRSIFPLFAATLLAGTAFAFEITLSSGMIPLPEADGSFSATETTDGVPVLHAYYIIPQAKFTAYTGADSSAAAIYNDFIAGAVGWTEVITYPSWDWGHSEFDLSVIFDDNDCEWLDYDTDVFFAAVFVHEDLSKPATNYIARAFSIHTPTQAEDDYEIQENWMELEVRVLNIAIDAGRWEVIAPAPLEIRCTEFSLDSGNVRAAYEVSEYSRIMRDLVVDFMVSNTNVNVVASANLERTSVTNIPARVRGIQETTGGAGELRIEFPCPPNSPSLFLFGLEKP